MKWLTIINILFGAIFGLFVYFRSFQTQILQKKTVGFSGIRTQIVGVESEHADHLTTTTAPINILFGAILGRKFFGVGKLFCKPVDVILYHTLQARRGKSEEEKKQCDQKWRNFEPNWQNS